MTSRPNTPSCCARWACGKPATHTKLQTSGVLGISWFFYCPEHAPADSTPLPERAERSGA